MNRRSLTLAILLAVAAACELNPESAPHEGALAETRALPAHPSADDDTDTIHYSVVYQESDREVDGIFTVMGDTTLPYAPYEVYVEGFRSGPDMLAEYTKHSGDRCRLSGSFDGIVWAAEWGCAGEVLDTLQLTPVTTGGITGTIKEDDEWKTGEKVWLYDLDNELVMRVFTDTDGRYKFEDVDPGDYVVYAGLALDHYECDDEEAVTVQAGRWAIVNFHCES